VGKYMNREDLKYVCWNITTKCNKKCVYCFRELFESDRTLEDNMKILYKLKEAGVNRITFSGGEPLSYDGIIELARECKKLGIETFIVTNGDYVNEDNIELICDLFERITFSCDSPSSYVNKVSGRGEGNYEHILYLCYLINRKRPGHIVQINSVVTRENYGESEYMLSAMRNELYMAGVKRIKFFQFYPIRGYSKQRRSTLSITDEQFQELKRRQETRVEFFDVTFKDIEFLNRDCVVSPKGALKESENYEDHTLIEDITQVSSEELQDAIDTHYAKKKVGGLHV